MFELSHTVTVQAHTKCVLYNLRRGVQCNKMESYKSYTIDILAQMDVTKRKFEVENRNNKSKKDGTLSHKFNQSAHGQLFLFTCTETS